MMKEIKICRKCTWLKVYKYICECTKETCRLFRVGGGTDAQHPELAPPRNTWGGEGAPVPTPSHLIGKARPPLPARLWLYNLMFILSLRIFYMLILCFINKTEWRIFLCICISLEVKYINNHFFSIIEVRNAAPRRRLSTGRIPLREDKPVQRKILLYRHIK